MEDVCFVAAVAFSVVAAFAWLWLCVAVGHALARNAGRGRAVSDPKTHVFRVLPEGLRLIDQLQFEGGFRTREETIAYALGVYNVVLASALDGAQVVVRGRNGTELILPHCPETGRWADLAQGRADADS